MATRSEILSFIIEEYFQSSVENAAIISGYTKSRIQSWCSGKTIPRKATIQYFLQCAFVPEFKIIAEYEFFNHKEAVQTQLKKMLGEHAQDPGIYAFYDSLGNLIYIGKAKKLIAEITSALNRPFHLNLPKGVKNPPEVRKEVVGFISAYDVGNSDWGDYPKHVESLILRISKPILNKNIGALEKAYKAPKEA